jgi:hypothetical protein
MRHRLPLLVLSIVIATTAPRIAATVIYGPQQFVVATGRPQTFDTTFPIDLSDNCDGKAFYVLSISSGVSGAAHAVSSAVIALNGTIVVSQNDFNNRAQTFERQFTPLSSNALHVVINGGDPGSAVTVTVRKEIEEVLLAKSYSLTDKRLTISESFAASDLTSPYVLVVQNGANDGSHMARQVSLRVNGSEVMTDADLRDGGLVRRTISVQPTTLITGDVAGLVGDLLSISVHRGLDESACALAITITSPADGATVTTRPLTVSGTVVGRQDVGVAVVGVPARMDLTHSGSKNDPIPWVAVLNLEPGRLTLTATATAPSGLHRDASLTLIYAPSPQIVEILAIPPSGTAPFDTQFRIGGKFSQPVVKCELDLDGDGRFETTLTSLPEKVVAFHYATPGVRIATVQVTDALGAVMTSSTAIEVDSFSVVNAIIQGRWKAFTTALAAGDIDRALTYFAGDEEREKYRAPLTLIKPSLPQLAAEMATIRPVYVRGDIAKYLLTRSNNGVLEGYFVYFARGTNGLWAIVQF